MAFSPTSCAACTYLALQEASNTCCIMSFLRGDLYYFLASNSKSGKDSSTPLRQEPCRIRHTYYVYPQDEDWLFGNPP